MPIPRDIAWLENLRELRQPWLGDMDLQFYGDDKERRLEGEGYAWEKQPVRARLKGA